jgi:hypothetical protein
VLGWMSRLIASAPAAQAETKMAATTAMPAKHSARAERRTNATRRPPPSTRPGPPPTPAPQRRCPPAPAAATAHRPPAADRARPRASPAQPRYRVASRCRHASIHSAYAAPRRPLRRCQPRGVGDDGRSGALPDLPSPRSGRGKWRRTGPRRWGPARQRSRAVRPPGRSHGEDRALPPVARRPAYGQPCSSRGETIVSLRTSSGGAAAIQAIRSATVSGGSASRGLPALGSAPRSSVDQVPQRVAMAPG